MKILKPILAAGITLWLSLASPSSSHSQEKKEPVRQEQTSSVSLNAKVDFLSKYVSRGLAYSEKPVIQQTLSATYKDFSLIGFGNFNMQAGEFNEADLTLDFTKKVNENFSMSLGYSLFEFPNSPIKKTQEVYAGVTFDRLLNPSINVYHDFDDGRGTYAELSLGHDLNFGKTGISARAALGYNDHYYRDDSGLSHLELRLSAPISLKNNLTLSPKIAYSKSLDKNDFHDELYGGVSLNF